MGSRRLPSRPRILGYLGRALSLEFSAVQQYMTQAKLTESWGMIDASDRFRREVVEELRHTERITAYMLTLGAAPNASQLRPVRAGPTLRDLLVEDYRLEADIIRLYQDATSYCGRIGERDCQAFFEQLLREEEEHAEALQQWMQELSDYEQTVASAAQRGDRVPQ